MPEPANLLSAMLRYLSETEEYEGRIVGFPNEEAMKRVYESLGIYYTLDKEEKEE